MAPYRKLPDRNTLERWLDEGLTHKDIIDRIFEETGETVTLSTVSGGLSRLGLTDRVRYDDLIPWGRISVDHNSAYQLIQLRIGARVARGLPVTDLQKKRYEAWCAELDEKNLSVTYVLDSPEGFYYVARRDGEGIVRMPEPATAVS